MAATVTMEVNNRIEISTNENENAKSIIQEVSDDRIAIAVPVVGGKSYLLSNGDVVDCTYNDGKGNIYGFEAKVVGRKIERIPLIILETTSELEKIQRRDYVRIPFVNTIKYMPVDKYNESILQDLNHCDFYKGKSLDLSGGGMRVQMAHELNLGQLMVIKTVIGNSPVIAITEVIRSEGMINVKEKEFTYGIKFKYIDSKIREEIIGFIFSNMRRAIKVNK